MAYRLAMRAEVEVGARTALLFTPSHAAYASRSVVWQLFVQSYDGAECELLQVVEATNHPSVDELTPDIEPDGILEHFLGPHFLVVFGDGTERCLHYSNFTRLMCV